MAVKFYKDFTTGNVICGDYVMGANEIIHLNYNKEGAEVEVSRNQNEVMYLGLVTGLTNAAGTPYADGPALEAAFAQMNTPATSENQTSGNQKTQIVDRNGYPQTMPIHRDISSQTVIYRGYDVGTGTTLLISKTDLTDPTDVTLKFASGTWANRASLTYV